MSYISNRGAYIQAGQGVKAVIVEGIREWNSTRTPNTAITSTYLLRLRYVIYMYALDRYHRRAQIPPQENLASVGPQQLKAMLSFTFQTKFEKFFVLFSQTFINEDLIGHRIAKVNCGDRLQVLPCSVKVFS